MPLDEAPEFAPNPRATPGDNLPKSAQSIEAARETYKSIKAFLDSAIVIQDEETAQKAKLFLDRGNAAVADIEADLEREATPLRKIWMDCRAKFTPAIESFAKPIAELKARLRVFALAEEKRKLAILEEARRVAEVARLAALEAERIEREAKENASVGDCEAAVGTAIAKADAAFSEFKTADNTAARAYREATDTVIRGGFSRGIGLKDKKTLVVTDHMKAIGVLGMTDDIRDAILKGARAYKKLNQKLPDGVSEETNRTI